MYSVRTWFGLEGNVAIVRRLDKRVRLDDFTTLNKI